MSTLNLTDDLGDTVTVPEGGAQRVVSLVPSLTEAISASAPEVLVGATDWCTQPPDLAVTRVRGTKNPDLDAIAGLVPDLIVVNREENRQVDIQRMRERGLNVWVTSIDTVDEALASMRRLFTQALAQPVPEWLIEAEQIWAVPPRLDLSAALPIWRDPWMVAGSNTYSNDVLAKIGVRNVFADTPRYPRVELDEITRRAPLVILPDEPYAFSATEGPECFEHSVLVDGRATAWYGPAMVWARRHLEERLSEG